MAIDRIIVRDYNGLGNLFIDWALGRKKTPTNLADFKTAVGDLIEHYPDYIETFEAVQTPKKQHMLLRLPPAELVQETLDSLGREPYSFPQETFYGPRQVRDDRTFFGFRVGDYTISFCS